MVDPVSGIVAVAAQNPDLANEIVQQAVEQAQQVVDRVVDQVEPGDKSGKSRGCFNFIKTLNFAYIIQSILNRNVAETDVIGNSAGRRFEAGPYTNIGAIVVFFNKIGIKAIKFIHERGAGEVNGGENDDGEFVVCTIAPYEYISQVQIRCGGPANNRVIKYVNFIKQSKMNPEPQPFVCGDRGTKEEQASVMQYGFTDKKLVGIFGSASDTHINSLGFYFGPK